MRVERSQDFWRFYGSNIQKSKLLCIAHSVSNYYNWNSAITTIQLIINKNIFLKNVDTLASLYEDPNDVDFYVGGLLEKLKPGSLLGHTFQCISGEMFFRWKFGDRFFYEFGNQTGSFRPGNEWHFH